MKKILFINILALIFGAVQLNGQCSDFLVITQSTDETCEVANDGTATALPVAGTTPYFYNWSTGATTQTISGLTAGSYTVTVTDVSGCVALSIIQVELSPEGIWLMPSSTPVSCFGGNNGTGYPGVMSGTAPYTFTWDDPNNQTTETAVGLTAGSYHVTVTDVNGCSNVAPITVDSPTQVINTISNTTNETCAGNANGSISASASGGTGSISYSWSNGGSGNTINGLSAGTYTVTASDGNGCATVTSSTVGITNPIVAGSTSGTNVLCNGGNDGTATVNVTSGTAPYTYSWSNGQTGATATGLSPGTYDVTVTDANGCTWISSTNSSSVTITQNSVVSISGSNTTITNVACHGENNGSASVTASGGNGTYTYSWSNGSTGSSINGLAAGTYTVTATDGNGCTTNTTVTISEPSALGATGSTTGVTTPGGSDGSATLNVNGGTPGYTYSWSNGATTQTINGLSGGTYTVTITDANGCTTTTTVTVTTPQVLPITLIINNTSANCSNGSDGTATVSASGGMMPYTYLWSNGQTGATATGLAPGTYTVTVTDAQGNSETISTTIGSTGSNIVATASSSDETCAGSQDGHVSVSTSGGVGQMTFLWSNGATTSTVNGLSVGTYTITVTDENGCTATASTTIEISPEGVWVDVTPTHVACFGTNNGSATAVATTGTPPYTYAWSNGQTTPTATGLAAGNYTVTVTDANGCANSYTTTINGPSTGSTISISSTPTNIDCAGNMNGSVNIAVTGGNAGYTYSWSNGSTSSNLSGLGAGTYTLTVTDNSGCTSTEVVTITEPSPVTASGTGTNPSTAGGSDGSINLTSGGGTPGYTYLWSNGATTQNISGLTADCYTVTVTDANGCTAVSTTCITDPLSVPTVTTTTTSTSGCVANSTTGSATANPSSGTAPYMYLWNNGGTTQTISGIGAGTYTVTITDANGTTATSTTTVGTASNPTVTGVGTTANCGNSMGTATSTPSGGTPGYTYSWSNGATTQNISDLAAGTYTLTVTDTNGCTATTEVVIGAGSPPVIVMTTGTDPNTPMGMNGFVTANVSAGTQPFTYLWSNGGTTQTISGLSAGCYTVTVTDANNCTATAESCIVDPVPLVVNTTSTSSNECSGASTGTATAVVTTGVSPYTYLWSTGGTTETITGLAPGSYTVTVTDANGSMAFSTIVVGSVPMPTVVGTGSNLNCGINDGTAMSMPGGGTPGYTYLWSTNETTQNISGLGVGVYTVTVTDSNGCTATTEVNVIENSPAVNVTATGTDPSTPMGMNGFVTASVSGGSIPFTYLWSTGATTQTVNGLGTGCYTVTVTDNNNCTAEATTCITAPTPIVVTVTTTSSIECNGDNDGTATVTPTSGTAPYTYIWSDGQTTPTATGLTPGTYTVTVTDVNGAMAVETVTVGSLSNPTVSGTGSNINCGLANGSASAAGSGGTPFPGGGYNYLWNNNSTSSTINGAAVGTYTVTLTDANGCTATTEVNVIENSPAATVSTSGTNVTMLGGSDGTITASPGGGTPGFTYLWNTGATTQTISGLSAGCYTVTITDSVGCTAESTTCITAPTQIIVTITTTSSVECNGDNDGTATATPTSGTAPYTYLWNDSQGQTTPTATGLTPGTYMVTVTDANGGMAIETVVVGSLPNPSVSGTGSAINCGIGDGTASASGSGGTPFPGGGYNYLWNTGATTANLSNQPAGLYTVTVTDDNGCTATTEVNITENSPAAIVTTSPTNVTMNGANDGTITANPIGGTPGFTYLWNTGATTQTISGLSPGCYTVTITDSVGCTATSESCIVEPTAISAMITSTDDDCTAGDDGTATVTVLTGSPFYTYDWSAPITTTDSIATGLAPGTYTVTVTDITGMTVTQVITVGQTAGPDASAVATDISCNGMGDGTLTGSATNGTAPYTYLWSTANSDDTLFVDNQNVGTYTVTVTDANGCTDVATTAIAQDDPIDALSQIVPIECAGGPAASIAVIPSGGTAPYVYVWSTMATDSVINDLAAGDYTVTITDDNGCTAEQEYTIAEAPPIALEIGDTTITCDGVAMLSAITGTVDSIHWLDANGTLLGTGTTYEVIAAQGTMNMVFATAYGANGCTGMDSTVVIVPEELVLELSPQDTMVECEQFMLELTASNPNVASYTWYDDSGLTNEIGTGSELPGFLSSAPQFYYVVAEDIYGCPTVDSVFAGDTQILFSEMDNVEVCVGDSLVLNPTAISSSNSIINYTWVDENGVMLGVDSTLTLNPATDGMYIVQMTDEYGCLEEDSINVSSYDLLPLLSATADEDTILTGMESQLLAYPDDEGFDYLWSNANTITQNSETDRDPMVSPMETTNYQVTVTNTENGCSALTNVLVTVIDPTCNEPFIFFPNAFSPNDDGMNDVLYLRGFNVDEVYFMIFNRWGQKVFESNSQSQGWDGVFNGKKVCNDVYGFYLRVKCTNGEEYIKKGNVTVFN